MESSKIVQVAQDINFIQKKRDRESPKNLEISSFPTKEEEIENLKKAEQYWNKINSENIKEKLTKDKKFIFGNFTIYYYKRYLDSLKEKEVNLAVFNPDWFKKKKCLDIGCNVGTLTLLVALNFSPSYIEGVDIDYRLVSSAIKTSNEILKNQIFNDIIQKSEKNEKEKLKPNSLDSFIIKSENEKQTNELINQIKNLPKSFQLNLKNDYSISKAQNAITNKSNVLVKNQVFFKQENYVGELKSDIEAGNLFDTIICLNTSKWIHLNYGDIGIKVLFNNVYQQLKKGGIFLFEPQNFDSYKKKIKLSKEIHANYNNIKFFPNTFIDYLQKVYNFKLLRTVLSPSNSKKVYYRVIYVLSKE